MQFLFRSAELIIRRGLSLGVVAQILLYTLPNIIALTLPMALLFGVLVAVGRLSSDSELIAMRASGVGLGRLYRPVIGTGLAFVLLTGVVMFWLLPGGNQALTQTLLEATARSAARQVEPRVFSEDWERKVLYVFEAGASGWRGVFVADSIPGDLSEVTVARSGTVRVDEAGERVALHLEKVVSHKVDLAAPDRYESSASETTDQVLEDHLLSEERARVSQSKNLRSMTAAELRATIADRGKDLEQRRRAVVELHKKYSIPAACLAFAFLALPLGFNNRRGGKSSGFALSIAVIVGYYLLLNNGEKAARYGTVPGWLAAWGPNLTLAALAAVLAWRRNRDRAIFGFADRRRGRHAAKTESVPAAPTAGPAAAAPARRSRAPLSPTLVLRLPRPRLAFPNLLDRYVLRVFGANFALVTLSAMAVYLIADFGQIVDEIFKNKVPGELVARYYRYFSLQIFHDLAPLLVLITALVTFGLLSRNNEVTAAKALGVSLFRLGAPALVAAAGVALLGVFLQAQILPATNDKAAQLRDRIYGKPVARTFRRADRQWLFGQGRYIYNYRLYDERRQALQRLQVFEFDDDARLVRRLFAESAQYRDDRWVFTDTWTRTFRDAEVVDYQRRPGPTVVDYPETPAYFQAEIERPAQMRYGELRDYARELRAGGQPVPELEVQLQSRVAFPFVALVMCLVALPFAFRLGRHGALYGLGLSVVLGIVYLVVYAFFKTLGETGALPAAVAVWSPSALFAMLAAYLFLGVRS